MAKILALDLGDQWTGVAISDTTGLVARPYHTIATEELNNFLQTTLEKEAVKTVVIGYPTTLKGTVSKQTEKVLKHKAQLMLDFPGISWILWDERLSSKRAEADRKMRTKEDKLKAQARAAAFILDSYLVFQKANINNI